MHRVSKYAAKKLAKAIQYPFNEPVTAYFTSAIITACCCVGVVHRHVRADKSGRFQNGTRLRTSDIVRAEKRGSYWMLYTASGSLYVIVTFHPQGGYQSLATFLQMLSKGFHPTPARLY